MVSGEVQADTNDLAHRIDVTAVGVPWSGTLCGSCDGYDTYRGMQGFGAAAGYGYRLARHLAVGTRLRYQSLVDDEGASLERVSTFDIPLLVSVPIAVGKAELEPSLGVGWQHVFLPRGASANVAFGALSLALSIRASERVWVRFAAGVECGLGTVRSDNTYTNRHTLVTLQAPVEIGVRFAF